MAKKEDIVVLEMEIVNNKAIRCFHLKSDGKNIAIAGDTGQGKTTAASTLWNILEKGKDTVTRGEKSGDLRIKLGSIGSDHFIRAERHTTKSGKSETKLQHVRVGEDGKEKPMDMTMEEFKSMISSLSVNPQDIGKMKPKELLETLMESAKVSIDLEATDAQIEAEEAKRLQAKRDADRTNPGDRPEKAEAVSVTALVKEKDEADAKNAKVRENLNNLDNLHSDHELNKEELVELKIQIAELEKGIADREIRIKKGDEWKKTADLIDTSSLVEQIESAEETNRKANEYSVWESKREEYDDFKEARTEADDKVKKLRAEKKEALENAEWPLEGLCVEEGEVVYKGDLFENLGESDRMKVCVALAAEIIDRGEFVKAIRMDGIESMSVRDFDETLKICNRKGIQVISTRVSRDGTAEAGEILITDGEIVKQETE